MNSQEMVYAATLNGAIIDRNLLYCAIPCVLKGEYSQGEVVSLRMDGLCKGRIGKFFPNALIMEICHFGYKRHTGHTKIFSNGGIQACGIPNEATFIDIISMVCKILNDAENYIAKQSGKNYDQLLNECKGPKCISINTFSLKNDDDLGSITFCKHSEETSILWPNINCLNNCNCDNCQSNIELKKRCDDLLVIKNIPHSALIARVNALTSSKRQPRIYKLESFKLCSVVLKYDLGYTINRYALVDELEKRGYTTYFANASSSGVTVYTEAVSDEKIVFNPRGSVRHSGPSLDKMLESKKKILALLENIENLIKLS